MALSAQQKTALRLMVQGDMKQVDIAERVKVSEQTICNWKKNDEFMAEYDSMLRSLMNGVAAKAFRTHTNLLDARSEMVRYMAAKDILDRAGYAPVDKSEISADIGLELMVDYGDEPETNTT